ncbi:MAG TPA: DUF2059 domain-containing protein [Thermoanaerobaculia bacterium]
MKRTILAGLAVLCLLALAHPLQAQEGITKEQDIRRLLVLTGSDKLAEQIMDQMMVTFDEDGADKGFWDSLRAEIDTEELIRMTIPIYDKHLTHEEIRGLIAFYQTPLGAKLIEKLPAIAQDSMLVGMKWGEEVAGRAMAKLEERRKKEGQPEED